MDYPRLPYEEFMSIYHKVPRAAVDIVVQTPQGIVLTKRSISPFLGMWHICGGTILFKEPIKHAIDRIIQEELGIKVKVIKPLGIIEYFNDGGRHTICNVFLAKIIKGELRGSEQGREFTIFNQLPDNCIPEQKAFLLKNHLPQ
jgi:ADP-ribose pyrophosphatase YjhB (NUDIX family)